MMRKSKTAKASSEVTNLFEDKSYKTNLLDLTARGVAQPNSPLSGVSASGRVGADRLLLNQVPSGLMRDSSRFFLYPFLLKGLSEAD